MEGREVWEAQWSKGVPVLDRSRILRWETWNGGEEGFWELFCWSSIYLFLHENITSFLFCRFSKIPAQCFQKACQCQIRNRAPWDHYCIICERAGVEHKNMKGSSRVEWFYWLSGVNWPLSNQANKLSRCSGVLHCEPLDGLLLTNFIYSRPSQ